MNMAEPFTDAELQDLAARESKARQHFDESSTQSVFDRSSKVSQSNNPTATANDAKYRAEFRPESIR